MERMRERKRKKETDVRDWEETKGVKARKKERK
jgi:hypothetical protein